jgi:hypothetical protein
MKTIELKNNFHNTGVALRVELLDHGTHLETTLSESQMKKSKKALCGIKGCTCAFAAGTRGSQKYKGKPLIVNPWTREQLVS